jgi:cytoskeletal protein RodZ
VRQLGEELLRVRQDRGISLYQLHLQTLVPLHHLKALETGQTDKLPEDIYVRGFVRRLGDALGLLPYRHGR